MSKQIYLDNAATTQMSDAVKQAMEPYLQENYGNASTAYSIGEDARRELEKSREVIAATLHAKTSEIYFTSGGSESDNWAVKNIAAACKKKGRHIITTNIEHHAILNSCEYLEKLGYDVTYLEVDGDGLISPEQVMDAIRPDTTLISVMFANNEVGTIEPIYQIGKIAREKQILFHTDAVQAYAQIPLSVNYYPVDLLSASAHKFHGPKGVGFLYIRDGIDIPSFIHGGERKTCRYGECSRNCRNGESSRDCLRKHEKKSTKRNYASQLSDRACTARNSGYKIEWTSQYPVTGKCEF